MIKHLRPYLKWHVFWNHLKDRFQKRNKMYIIDIEIFPAYDYPIDNTLSEIISKELSKLTENEMINSLRDKEKSTL